MSKMELRRLQHKEDWQRNANAWKWERPAQVALLLAIVSALGALFSWCMFLQGNDVRRNPLFWALAVPLMVWIGAVQATKRWAVRSLRLALVLWPVLSFAALMLARQQRAQGHELRLATPLTMQLTLCFTLLTAAAAFLMLRRSSLPGGTQTVKPRDASYRPENALPPADPELLALTRPFLACMFSWMFVGIVAFVARTELDPNLDRAFRWNFLPLMGMIPLVVGCFALGAVQSRRRPERAAPAYGCMLLAQSLYCVASVVGLGIAQGKRENYSGAAYLAMLGTLVQLLAAAYTWWRVKERSGLLQEKKP